MAEGFALNVDAQFLKQLEQADKAMADLIDKNNSLSKSAVEAFNKITTQGIDPYLEKLKQQKSALEAIANVKFSRGASKEMDDLVNASTKAIDKINGIITSLQGLSTPIDIKRRMDEQKKSLADFTKYETQLLMDRIAKNDNYNAQLIRQDENYYNKRKAIYEKLFSLQSQYMQEAALLSTKVYNRTDGKSWDVSAKDVINQNQQDLQERRNYIAQREQMYKAMFDEISRKEKKMIDDIGNYERSKFYEELTQYRKNKEDQLKVDKHYHDQRQAMYNKLFSVQAQAESEAAKLLSKVYNRTGGQTWDVSAENVIRKNQQDLEARRKYVEQRKTMYAQMFDEIEQKELKSQRDRIAKEQAADNEAYQLWLMRKHSEVAEQKRVEEEKLKATQDAIAKQNSMFAQLETYRQQSTQAKNNSIQAKQAYEQQYRDYERLFTEAIQREERLRQQAANAEMQRVIEVQDKKKRAEQDMRAIEQRNHTQRQKEYEDMFKSIERTENRIRLLNNARGDSSKGALNYANRLYSDKGIKSIDNMQRAIQKLQAAQNKLNLGTDEGRKKYDELGKKIQQIQKDLDKATQSNEKFHNSHSKLLNTTDQLQRKLALLFSVSAIQGYVDKLVTIRKEFELQQKSLQILLQSKDEANKLWQQTVDLAVRSPFRVKELVTYTRQLAAYRIETDKLHDTTKRLADVSAGLGVDMQRLILAFGQVRAANFLRGTELRQFTEAGIPMLDELAKYFTELEGRAISAGDVFERISKRMVSFADVEEVFHRMTNAGGVFYQMQEEQSKTLAGMISNLHDSIDLMLNDIGKSYDSTLKSSVNFAKYFVENWKAIGEAIKGVLWLLAAHKLYQLAAKESIIETAIAQGVVNAQSTKQLTLLQLLKVGWSKLTTSMTTASAAMKSFLSFSLPLLAVTALVTAVWELGSAWREHGKAIEDITKKYDDLRKKAEVINVGFNIASNEKDLKEQKARLNELVTLANNDYNMKIRVDVEGMDAKEIQEKFNEISQQLFDANIFAEHFAKAMQQATEWVVEDDIFEDLEELGTKSTELLHKLSLNRERIVFDLQKAQNELNESQLKALKLLSKPKDIDESEVQYLERIASGYRILINEYGILKQMQKTTNSVEQAEKFEKKANNIAEIFKRIGLDVYDITNSFNDYGEAIEEAKNEFDSFIKNVNLDENLSDEQKEIRLKTAIDKQAAEKEWNEFVKDYIYRWTEEAFNIKFNIQTTEDKGLEDWQVRVNEAITTVNNKIKAANKDIPENWLFPLSKEGQTREQFLNLAKSYLDIADATYVAGQKIVDKAITEQTNALKPFSQEVKNILNITDKTSGRGQGKDWWSEMAKGIQNLRKEFVDLNKTFDANESKQIAMEKHMGVLQEIIANLGDKGKEIDLGSINFTTEQGTIDALTLLKEMLPESAKNARVNIEKALSDITGSIRISDKQQNDKKLIDQIEDMFSGYEMSIELQKLNIPPDLAKQLFNLDSLTLPELKDKLIELRPQFEGKDMLDKWNDFLKKIGEMEDKQRVENLKKYSKYLQKAQSERVKIKLEEIRQIQEIENLNIDEGLKDQMKQGVRHETQQKLDKEAWDSFKNTDLYIQMFEDLGVVSNKVLDDLKDRLANMRGSLSNLSPTELKEIVAQLEKITDEQISRNPFKNFGSNMKEGIAALKRLKAEQEDYNSALKKQEQAQKDVDSIKIAIETAKAEKDKAKATIQSKDAKAEEVAQAQLTIIALDSNIAANEELLKLANERLNQETKTTEQKQEQLTKTQLLARAATKTLNSIGAYGTQAVDSIQNLTGMLENWGVDFGEEFKEVLSGVGQMFSALESIDLTKPMSIITGSINFVAGLGNTFASLFGFGNKDKKKERQIQREMKLIEDLERTYEKLEKQIDEAYTIDTLKRSYDNAQKNLNEQIAARQRMIALEEDKKKTDNDKIKQYQQEIEDLREQQNELLKTQVEELGGGYDFSSITEEFVNSWLDAFKETGDGLSGLEENFEDFWTNIALKQAVMGGASKIMQPLLDAVNKALEDDFKLDDSEMSNIDSLSQKAKEDMNLFLQQWYDRWGDFMSQGESGELSGLQRGIQQLTESTGQELAAYLNSIRFFVSEQNVYLSQIASYMTNPDVPNPILSELRTQTELVRGISTLLNSMTTSYPNGGRGWKVVL